MAEILETKNPVLHVIVVGFHHKKGCQVDYAYPPLLEGNPVDSHIIPEEWKNLPSLALPDGAHNYLRDTVYFHLPGRNGSKETVYGVSCYKQMDAKDLINKDVEVTRNTIQKSVCVISKLPLYGLIQAKLELITHAYFRERDFTQVSLLEETFQNLNSSLTNDLVQGTQVFLGLHCRELVQLFKHKIVMIFKLMLLERKVLFFGSPVKPTCTTLLTVLSLFPGMIESGLLESASYSPRKVSSIMHLMSVDSHTEEYLEVKYQDANKNTTSKPMTPDGAIKPDTSLYVESDMTRAENCDSNDKTNVLATTQSKWGDTVVHSLQEEVNKATNIRNITHVEAVQLPQDAQQRLSLSENGGEGDSPENNAIILQPQSSMEESPFKEAVHLENPQDLEQLLDAEDQCFSWEDDKLLLEINDALSSESASPSKSQSQDSMGQGQKDKSSNAENNVAKNNKQDKEHERRDSKSSISSKGSDAGTPSQLGTKAVQLKNKLVNVWQEWGSKDGERTGIEMHEIMPSAKQQDLDLPVDDFGFPLALFSKGSLCHPYLSLQYYDLLSDVNVRSFTVGATNILFKQKKHLVDVIVEVHDTKMDIHDLELRKQLNLTTADLRFADYLVKMVSDDSQGNMYLDDTGWEGGDEWLRAQFKMYLLSLLSTMQDPEADKYTDDFNPSFIQAWKTTHNYKLWKSVHHESMSAVEPGHPFAGQMGVGDMRLRLSHNLQNTEKGKKINAAVVQTGKVVVQTGKAVGGAFTTARSAVTSWFTNMAKDWNAEKAQQSDTEDEANTSEPGY